MTAGQLVTYQRAKGARLMPATVKEVHEAYILVVVGGKFRAAKPDQIRGAK